MMGERNYCIGSLEIMNLSTSPEPGMRTFDPVRCETPGLSENVPCCYRYTSAVIAMGRFLIFVPKLSLSVDPDPDLLLLDSYIPLVQAKTASERFRQIDTPASKQLDDIVERIGKLAREKYGDEQGQRVNEIGRALAREMTSEREAQALLQQATSIVSDALKGRGEPVSDELRGRLERYCRLVGAYYIELRCKHLWRRQRYRFWEAIVALHDSLLYHSLLGTTEAKHTGETAPDQVTGCGEQTRDFVKSGYSELVKG